MNGKVRDEVRNAIEHLLRWGQTCNKSVSWYLGYRTFLEENSDIFKQLLQILAYLA